MNPSRLPRRPEAARVFANESLAILKVSRAPYLRHRPLRSQRRKAKEKRRRRSQVRQSALGKRILDLVVLDKLLFISGNPLGFVRFPINTHT
jgi:hypothetical protein